MRVLLSNIDPNPYRMMSEYPVDREKVEALKTSIREKTFWDNLLARPHPAKRGRYQISYGHHRLISLQELKIKEINLTVRDISNADMLKIMAEENLAWSTSPKITLQTVKTTKKYLDDELAKYQHLNRADKIISSLFDNEGNFQQSKQHGVGRDIILKFLGGNWKGWMVQEALGIIKSNIIDRESVEKIPTLEQAKEFKRGVHKYKTPVENQKTIANEIVTKGVGKRDIQRLVEEMSPPIPNLKKQKKKPSSKIPNIVEYIFKLESESDTFRRKLEALNPVMAELVKNGRLLNRLLPALDRLSTTISEVQNDYEKAKKAKTKKVACS